MQEARDYDYSTQQLERQTVNRSGWSRAAVSGANDGILS
eukprot:COSAG02_NODE_35612_length_466_cov_0.577657_2_plen_38_part_01